MCGRYAMTLSPSQVRRMLTEQDIPVSDAPPDDGYGAPRQSYNFCPGYHGLVYRADTPDWGAGRTRDEEDEHQYASSDSTAFKLQSMQWGLIPSWTKRNPNFNSMMKTINCRDDSLSTPGGLWASMKGRKRCIIIAEGFYEWLKTNPKDKLPHHVKRSDGRLMFFAGLWDCVKLQDSQDKKYTYTVITTDSNSQMKFLHDRMPVILDPGSQEMRTWLDPSRYEWSRDLQSILKPFTGGLDVYPVTKEVGKVGNNSPSFIVPLYSSKNKSNIANFFTNASGESGEAKPAIEEENVSSEVHSHPSTSGQLEIQAIRENSDQLVDQDSSATKKRGSSASPPSPSKAVKISATSNPVKKSNSPRRPISSTSHKITNFFTTESKR